ncbi:MAG: CBS domain-containing protein [Candidatus Competibacteraceae bacterium]
MRADFTPQQDRAVYACLDNNEHLNKLRIGNGTQRANQPFLATGGDFMSPLPPTVTADTTCLDVVELMRLSKAPRVLVLEPAGEIAGIISTGDILHQVTFATDTHTPAQAVMSRPVHKVRADLPLFRAVALMRERGLRHLPVVDQETGRKACC